MSEFYVGQRVVCVRSHSMGVVAVGKTYVVNGVRKCAICPRHALDVGIASPNPWAMSLCVCGSTKESMGIYWVGERLFRPIDSLTEQMDRIEEEGAPVELEPEYA